MATKNTPAPRPTKIAAPKTTTPKTAVKTTIPAPVSPEIAEMVTLEVHEKILAPKPAKAGTTYTPSVLFTSFANASTSEEFLIKCKPSLNHCTTAPPINTLPSNA